MRILVTGGAGLIGSHLIRSLLANQQHVICMDNLHTSSGANLSAFMELDNFEFLQHDVIEKIDLRVDQIYNLACPASPIHYQMDPVRTVKTSVMGAINLLDLAREQDARILQASTSEIYGHPELHPQPETYWGNVNPIGRRSCYDEGKRCAETLFYDYHREYAVDIRVARIFNTYGSGMQEGDGRVISNFIVQALAGNAITLYGDGEQTRSFCHVSDMVSGLQKLMQSDYTKPVNLGNPAEISMRSLAQRIIEKTGTTSTLIYKPLPDDDPAHRKPDITIARSILNWEPETCLDTGLEQTIAYFKKLHP